MILLMDDAFQNANQMGICSMELFGHVVPLLFNFNQIVHADATQMRQTFLTYQNKTCYE